MSLTINMADTAVPFAIWRPGDVLTNAIIVLDTETTKTVVGQVPDLIVAIATDGQRGFVIARQHVCQFFDDHRRAIWLMHNAAFDLAVLDRLGVRTVDLVEQGAIYDTGLLYRLLKLADRGDCHGRWSLDHVTRELLGVELPKDVKSADGQDIRTTFGRFLKPDGTPDYPAMLKPEHRGYLEYAAADPVVTWLVGRALNRWARRLFDIAALDIYNPATYSTVGMVAGVNVAATWRHHGFLTHHIQLKGSVALAAIERRGMRLDAGMIGPTVAKIDSAIAIALSELANLGWKPGPGSGKTLDALFAAEERRLKVRLPRTDKGKYARSRDQLAEVAPKSELITRYLDYQDLNKVREVFLKPLDNAQRVARGRFHVLVNTGRTSCSGYEDGNGHRLGLNLQNLPRSGHIRECFIPREGYLLLACDYCGIELCTLAQHMVDRFGHSTMAEILQRGADLHCVLAARLAGVDISNLSDWKKSTIMPLLGPQAEKLRQQAKGINFGYPGGLGVKTYTAYAKATYGLTVTEDEARSAKQAWLEQWPEMRMHLADDGLLRLARRHMSIWQTHPSAPRSFESDQVPWPVHVFRGILLGNTTTKTSNREYTPAEIDWTWNIAAEIVEHAEHLNDKIKRELLARIQARQPGKDLFDRLIPTVRHVATLTGRLRGYPTYCAARNTVFQGLAADGAKLALFRLHREGFHVVNFIHDEVLIEVPEHADHAALAERVRQIMIEEMRRVVPDIPIECEYALMRRWHKGAKAVFEDGRLVPCRPVETDGGIKWVSDTITARTPSHHERWSPWLP